MKPKDFSRNHNPSEKQSFQQHWERKHSSTIEFKKETGYSRRASGQSLAVYLLLKIRAARISFPEPTENTLSNASDFWMLDNKTGKRKSYWRSDLNNTPERLEIGLLTWTKQHTFTSQKSTFYIINQNDIYIYTHTHTAQGLAFPWPRVWIYWWLGTKMPCKFKLDLKMKWKVSIVTLNPDLLMLDHISS